MSSQYRICHNCGASLTANEAFCPRCGARYVEPMIQQPGEFEPFPPEKPGASEQTEPNVAQPQQPVVLPPPQSQAPYPPQGQSYAPATYSQQAGVTPGQVGGPPQPPTSDEDNRFRTNVVIGLIVLVVLLLLGFAGVFVFASQNNKPSATTPTPGVTPTPTPGTTMTATPTPIPFKVTTIDMSVNPVSIAGMSCGSQLTVVYTATVHVLANGPGGAVQYTYTTDGGRTHQNGVVQFSPGQTSNQVQFSSPGTLAPNGAFPGSGQITTTSPNSVSSQAITPSGSCTPVTPTP